MGEQLFSESNSRFVVEVDAQHEAAFLETLGGVPCVKLGVVSGGDNVNITAGGQSVVGAQWRELYDAWHSPLDWA